jgi:four helix bundle protein
MFAMNPFLFPFEKLDVWQESKAFVIKIYHICEHFPGMEKFGLSSQIKRAGVSIAANIAEGTSRSSFKDQTHFTEIAYGSVMESACLSIIGKELGFIDQKEYKELRDSMEGIANKLNGLRKYQLSRSNR